MTPLNNVHLVKQDHLSLEINVPPIRFKIVQSIWPPLLVRHVMMDLEFRQLIMRINVSPLLPFNIVSADLNSILTHVSLVVLILTWKLMEPVPSWIPPKSFSIVLNTIPIKLVRNAIPTLPFQLTSPHVLLSNNQFNAYNQKRLRIISVSYVKEVSRWMTKEFVFKDLLMISMDVTSPNMMTLLNVLFVNLVSSWILNSSVSLELVPIVETMEIMETRMEITMVQVMELESWEWPSDCWCCSYSTSDKKLLLILFNFLFNHFKDY